MPPKYTNSFSTYRQRAHEQYKKCVRARGSQEKREREKKRNEIESPVNWIEQISCFRILKFFVNHLLSPRLACRYWSNIQSSLLIICILHAHEFFFGDKIFIIFYHSFVRSFVRSFNESKPQIFRAHVYLESIIDIRFYIWNVFVICMIKS